ncbi:putative UPF0769 protein C21orf59 [Paratrimastix pyriformis]|uniref:UPF0769 protein C21orf59 n=1 Tax=Paratrimastix pyriformis TaxID=342808 RepID=A0ABQ8UFH2_9EUKA|nr:putative UPF0769 protein C21orf59 [Paratrimastix pyriformis]
MKARATESEEAFSRRVDRASAHAVRAEFLRQTKRHQKAKAHFQRLKDKKKKQQAQKKKSSSDSDASSAEGESDRSDDDDASPERNPNQSSDEDEEEDGGRHRRKNPVVEDAAPDALERGLEIDPDLDIEDSNEIMAGADRSIKEDFAKLKDHVPFGVQAAQPPIFRQVPKKKLSAREIVEAAMRGEDPNAAAAQTRHRATGFLFEKLLHPEAEEQPTPPKTRAQSVGADEEDDGGVLRRKKPADTRPKVAPRKRGALENRDTRKKIGAEAEEESKAAKTAPPAAAPRTHFAKERLRDMGAKQATDLMDARARAIASYRQQRAGGLAPSGTLPSSARPAAPGAVESGPGARLTDPLPICPVNNLGPNANSPQQAPYTMLIHLKKNEHEFVYETTLNTPVDQVIADLVNILNLYLKVKRLLMVVPDLAQHGPQRPPETQGLDECLPQEELEKIKAACVPGVAEYCPDPNGLRTGQAPIQAVRETLMKTVEEVTAITNKENLVRHAISLPVLEEGLARLRGAVMIAYPQGLPEFDPVRIILDNQEDLTTCAFAKDILDPATAMLWFSNRQIERGRPLKDFMRGCTERTKAVCKLTRGGSMAPAREAPMSTDEEKQMMAYWYHRQEEEKRMKAEAEELGEEGRAEWARPTSLGAGGPVSWR